MLHIPGIVMTASKKNSKATMRLERLLRDQIDLTKVHHVAGGPYKGILINKAADGKWRLGFKAGWVVFLLDLLGPKVKYIYTYVAFCSPNFIREDKSSKCER